MQHEHEYVRAMTVEPSGSERTYPYADIEALPETLVGERIDGELVVSPRPTSLHTRVASRLGTLLGGPFDVGAHGPGGWVILDEPELWLRSDVLVPDLAGWRRTRMPRVPDVQGIEIVPDWICEVLSPSTERTDRVRKMRAYAGHGVQNLWLVNPMLRVLEVYRLEQGRWSMVQVFEENMTVRAEPFDAIELDLAQLWER